MYGGSAFVVLQVVDIVAEGLALSPLALQVVTVLILAGFPIALGLAWAFEVTPDGVRRTDPTRIAIAHVALGDGDEAFRWLERAFEVSSPFFSELRDPRYDQIRDDPRFQDLMRRANLVD
jgi:hypothetical protein